MYAAPEARYHRLRCVLRASMLCALGSPHYKQAWQMNPCQILRPASVKSDRNRAENCSIEPLNSVKMAWHSSTVGHEEKMPWRGIGRRQGIRIRGMLELWSSGTSQESENSKSFEFFRSRHQSRVRSIRPFQ